MIVVKPTKYVDEAKQQMTFRNLHQNLLSFYNTDQIYILV